MRTVKILCAAAIVMAFTASEAQAQQSTIAELIRFLRDDNVAVRRAAAFSLKSIPNNETAIPGLISVLKDPDARVRDNAADALALMYPRDAIPPLVLATRDQTSPLIRQKAAEVLGRFLHYAQPVVPDLIRLLKDDNASVRQAAVLALWRIQGGGWQ